MGKNLTGGQELLSQGLVSGTFTATGQSGNAVRGLQTGGASSTVSPIFKGMFNASLWGTFVGTIKLEKSFDGGATWVVCSKDSSGAEAAYTAPVALGVYEPEPNIFYRWKCTAFTSGTINYRISA